MPIAIVLLLVLLALTGPAAAQDEPPGQARLSAPDGVLTVGDPIALTLAVTHPADHHLIAPDLETNWGDFTIQGVSAPAVTEDGDGWATTEVVIDARLFAPGTFTSQPLPVKLADEAGQVVELIAPPLTLEISSVLVAGDSELRDIKPQAELSYVNLIPWIAGAVALAAVTSLLVLIIRRRRAKWALAALDNRLPHEIALDELAQIEGLQLPEQNRYKAHYSAIADCLRLYMEARVDVPMLERTTAEIRVGLRDTALPRPIADRYVALLEASDLVKFSKFRPDATAAYSALESARQIVLDAQQAIATDVPADENHGHMAATRQASQSALSNKGSYQQTEVGA